LQEYNWNQLKEKIANSSQNLNRWKDQSNTALYDLSLIAKKIPEVTQENIFTREKMEPLILNILKMTFALGQPCVSINKLDTRRARLCAMLIDRCTKFCISQYALLEQRASALTRPLINQLQQSVEICNEIANKIELEDLRNFSSRPTNLYLFNWEDVTKKDRRRLEDFLYEDTSLPVGVSELKKSQDGKSLTCKLLDEGRIIYSVEITINENGDVAELKLTDYDTNKEYKENLQVLQKNGRNYIYKKNK
jgi:hypothetical protein